MIMLNAFIAPGSHSAQKVLRRLSTLAMSRYCGTMPPLNSMMTMTMFMKKLRPFR